MAYSVLDAVIDNLVNIDDVKIVNNPSYVKALTYLYEVKDSLKGGYEIPLEDDLKINYEYKED